MVEWGGLENRWALTSPQGSNPCLSAIFLALSPVGYMSAGGGIVMASVVYANKVTVCYSGVVSRIEVRISWISNQAESV